MTKRYELGLLLVVALTILFLNLGGPSLWDEDEPRNAGCAVEMMSRGDWVVPWFNGEIRTHKPVLLYWLMMSAYTVLGVSEFSARFWSAALGVGTVLLTYLMGRRLFGGRAGLYAGLALCSTIMFPVAARAATPDSVLIFLITAALAVFIAWTPRFDHQDSGSSAKSPFPENTRAIVAMYSLMGLATLAKGPIGFLLPTAIIGMYLLVARLPTSRALSDQERTVGTRLLSVLRPWHPMHFLRTCRSMRLDLLVLCVLTVALPWYVLVTLRSDGQWTRGFFFEHNLGRAVGAMENHSGPPIYYPIALIVGSFPWSIFLIPFLIDLVRTCRTEPQARDTCGLAICWVVVVVGLFTLASTKLPSYITPCYPGLALLAGRFLDRLSVGEARIANFWPQISYSVLGVVGLAIAVAIPVVATEFVPGIEMLGSIGVVLVIGALAASILWYRQQPGRSVQVILATSAVFTALLFTWGAVEVGKRQEIGQLMATLKAQSDDPSLGSLRTMRSTWVFYSGTTVRHVGGEDGQKAVEFVTSSPDHFLIATESEYQHVRDQMPNHITVLDSVQHFLEDESLVLVGHTSTKQLARRDSTNWRKINR